LIGNKFKLDEDGTIAIEKLRDVVFASPVLGGSILPQDVQEEWSEMEKTLEEWASSSRPLRKKNISPQQQNTSLACVISKAQNYSRLQQRRRVRSVLI
jgi:NurA-like 5'-3' nuclease